MEAAATQYESLTSRRSVSLLVTMGLGHSVVHWFAQAFPLLLAEIVTNLGLGPVRGWLNHGRSGHLGGRRRYPHGHRR